MADQSVEPHVVASLKLAAPYVPGFAGAVLALTFLEKLTPRGRLVAVAVGLVAASFLGPALSALADLFWPGVLPAPSLARAVPSPLTATPTSRHRRKFAASFGASEVVNRRARR